MLALLIYTRTGLWPDQSTNTWSEISGRSMYYHLLLPVIDVIIESLVLQESDNLIRF